MYTVITKKKLNHSLYKGKRQNKKKKIINYPCRVHTWKKSFCHQASRGNKQRPSFCQSQNCEFSQASYISTLRAHTQIYTFDDKNDQTAKSLLLLHRDYIIMLLLCGDAKPILIHYTFRLISCQTKDWLRVKNKNKKLFFFPPLFFFTICYKTVVQTWNFIEIMREIFTRTQEHQWATFGNGTCALNVL